MDIYWSKGMYLKGDFNYLTQNIFLTIIVNSLWPHIKANFKGDTNMSNWVWFKGQLANNTLSLDCRLREVSLEDLLP